MSEAANPSLREAQKKSAEGNGQVKPDVILAIPSRGSVRIEWTSMFREIKPPMNTTFTVRLIIGKEVVEARNIAVKDAIDKGTEFLCFLDDDVMVSNHTLPRMFYAMRENPDWDLITGIVPTKDIGVPVPCVYRDGVSGPFMDWVFPEVFPIDACGLAYCLIRMEKVREMPEPWFAWPKWQDGEIYREVGEDIYFTRKLKEMGGTLMADGGILCGHMKENGDIVQMREESGPIRNAAPDAFRNTRILRK